VGAGVEDVGEDVVGSGVGPVGNTKEH